MFSQRGLYGDNLLDSVQVSADQSFISTNSGRNNSRWALRLGSLHKPRHRRCLGELHLIRFDLDLYSISRQLPAYATHKVKQQQQQ